VHVITAYPVTSLWTALQILSDPPVFNCGWSPRAIALCKIFKDWDALPSTVFALHPIREELNATARPRSAPSEKDGTIARKHGNTLIGTLRRTYGQHFAEGIADTESLSDVLHRLDDRSLSQVARDTHDVQH
jgi:hypothetical protein